MPIPFSAALPINVKPQTIHAANGSVVFTCACGAGPFLLSSFDSIVKCLSCSASYRIGEIRMTRGPAGIDVGARLDKVGGLATDPQ